MCASSRRPKPRSARRKLHHEVEMRLARGVFGAAALGFESRATRVDTRWWAPTCVFGASTKSVLEGIVAPVSR
jgi:hypothetical protein